MKNNSKDSPFEKNRPRPSKKGSFSKPKFSGEKRGRPHHTSKLNRKTDGKTTAWSDGAKWYNEQLGAKGSYYHEKLIIPHAMRLLGIKASSEDQILDVGCGQGVFARHLPPKCSYVGIDLSEELLSHAMDYNYPCKTHFLRCDATKYSCKAESFNLMISLLSLQNMENPLKVVENLKKALVKGGKWLVILNHPAFRIPRNSSWEVDQEHNIQYRRIDHYMSPQSTSMQIHPSLGEESPLTWNFHHPLSEILSWFLSKNFVLTKMEEWCSDKKSTGVHAQREDKARDEFPLFMALLFELKI